VNKKIIITDNDLESLILRFFISNPNATDEQIIDELELSSRCDSFEYNKELIEIRIAVVRLEHQEWKIN
jgi:hypothetical protein